MLSVVHELNTSITKRHSVSHCALSAAWHNRRHCSAPVISCEHESKHFFAGDFLHRFRHLRITRRPSHGFRVVTSPVVGVVVAFAVVLDVVGEQAPRHRKYTRARQSATTIADASPHTSRACILHRECEQGGPVGAGVEHRCLHSRT